MSWQNCSRCPVFTAISLPMRILPRSRSSMALRSARQTATVRGFQISLGAIRSRDRFETRTVEAGHVIAVGTSLAGRLRRAQPGLRSLGIDLVFSREGRAGTRTITMRWSVEHTDGIVSSSAA